MVLRLLAILTAGFLAASVLAGKPLFAQAEMSERANRDDTIMLDAASPRDVDAQDIRAALDPNRELTIADVIARDSELFSPLPGDTIDFDYTGSQIWLRIPVTNTSDLPINPVMVMHARFMHHLEAYRLDERASSPEPILQDSVARTFNQREIPYRHLATRVPLRPGQSTVIYIGYWSDGASEMPISFETPASFEALSARADVINATVYAACLAMVIFTLLSAAIMRWRVHVAYALYFGCVILFLAHMEGYTFKYLWPDWPRFNAYGSLSIGYGLSFFAILFTREFLKLREHARWLDLIGIAIMVATVLTVALGSLGDTLFIKRFGFVFNFGTTLYLITAAIVSIRNKRAGAVYYLIGWSAIFLATLLSAVAHWIEDVFALTMTSDFIAAAVLFEAVIFTMAINAQVRVLREEKADAMAARLAASEENLQLERERADALAKAEARRTQLASASHDAKQPLMALRLALQGDLDESPHGEQLGEILSYLDSLIARQLSETRPDKLPQPAAVTAADNAETKFAAHDLVRRLDNMFRSEAEAKGLNFHARARTAWCRTDPMAVLRILSNLVANAIQHSDSGRVGVMAWTHGGKVRFEVCDSGPGLTADELDRMMQPYVKGPRSDGDGLGLIIARELAAAYDLDLIPRTRPGRGMRFTLVVPAIGENT